MPFIKQLSALEILDSRGKPTLQVTVTTDTGASGTASVPSGASTGSHEAVELRDRDKNRYFGFGVTKAVAYVAGPLSILLEGKNIFNQIDIDRAMIDADGTSNKSKFGANSILAVSLAAARAAACERKMPFYRYVGGLHAHVLPCPLVNIINGGVHADSGLDIQEFMIRPVGAPSFVEAIRWASEIFHALKSILKDNGETTSVGDEGGFAPQVSENEQALDYIMKAIQMVGLQPGRDISIALDCAASEFFDKKENVYVELKNQHAGKPFVKRTSQEMIDYLQKLCQHYPIDSLEDPLDENDWEGWAMLSQQFDKNVQIVGDDLFVTNIEFLQKGIQNQVGNAILIKPNQVGTLTETLDTIALARQNGYATVISHRSGETEDTTIADLAVATNAGQIKTGSLCRSERVSKLNRLIAIADELGSASRYYKEVH